MPRYMLDTDTCSYIMKRSHPLVLKRLQAVPVADVSMSVVTKAELLYGVEVSPRRAQDAAALAAFLPYVEALDFTDDAAVHYAEIRADLKRRGAMIGANDLFIAAHARALGLTLVTNNTAEFERVKGLAIENGRSPHVASGESKLRTQPGRSFTLPVSPEQLPPLQSRTIHARGHYKGRDPHSASPAIHPSGRGSNLLTNGPPGTRAGSNPSQPYELRKPTSAMRASRAVVTS